jgi:hypothetical protein
VRTVVGVGLLVLCPILIGCASTRDKRNDSARRDGTSGPRPFTGAPTTTQPTRAEREAAAQVSYSGVLAGYVRDNFNRPMGNGFILVVDLSDPSGKTKLDVAIDTRGEFVIPRLTPGHNYKLIARVKDGSRLLAGAAQATPPKPNINILVSEEFVGPDTPPLPDPAALPGRTPEPPDKGKPKEKEKETKPAPAAGIGTPRTEIPTPVVPGSNITPPVAPSGPVDRTSIADEDGGFHRVKPEAPKVDIPNRKDVLPPPPSIPTPRPDERATPAPKARSDESSDAVPGTVTPVPSCLLLGKKLENFALNNLDGTPWEFKKDHKGRLVLLQFWSSTSPESLAGLSTLRELQGKYGTFGLQLIGIAYEQGAFAEQVSSVRSARGRYVINYVTLLGGGGQGPCPVRDQFVVETLPTLVLLGEDGQIIWRASGALDADHLTELRLMITRRLRINEP